MSWWNVLAAPLVAMTAFGCGRRFFFWSVMGMLFGFWALLALMVLPKRPIKEIVLPLFIQEIIKRKVIASWAKGINTPNDLLN
jgi:hypothetical protein